MAHDALNVATLLYSSNQNLSPTIRARGEICVPPWSTAKYMWLRIPGERICLINGQPQTRRQ